MDMPMVRVYISANITQCQRDLILNDLRAQTYDNWAIVDSFEFSKNSLLVYIRDAISMTTFCLDEIVKSHDEIPNSIVYSDYFDNELQEVVALPIWSPIRFLRSDFLGGFISFGYMQEGTPISLDNYVNDFFSLSEESQKEYCFLRIPKVLYGVSHGNLGTIRKENELSEREASEMGLSVIIPTRGTINTFTGNPYVYDLLTSIVEEQEFKEFLEIVIVGDTDVDHSYLTDVVDEFGIYLQISVIHYKESFNFSKKCNIGVQAARFENVLFLNDDMTLLSGYSLHSATQYLNLKKVGAVGALLHYPDGSIQHAGQIATHKVMSHAYHHQFIDDSSGLDLVIDHEVTGVTGAFLAIRKEVLDSVGGWDPKFPNSFNDVDLCLRLLSKGYRNVLMTSVRLIHHESVTRDVKFSPADYRLLLQKWVDKLDTDDYLRNPKALGRGEVSLSEHGFKLKSLEGRYIAYFFYIVNKHGLSFALHKIRTSMQKQRIQKSRLP